LPRAVPDSVDISGLELKSFAEPFRSGDGASVDVVFLVVG
jgi:hypothetical protein